MSQQKMSAQLVKTFYIFFVLLHPLQLTQSIYTHFTWFRSFCWNKHFTLCLRLLVSHEQTNGLTSLPIVFLLLLLPFNKDKTTNLTNRERNHKEIHKFLTHYYYYGMPWQTIIIIMLVYIIMHVVTFMTHINPRTEYNVEKIVRKLTCLLTACNICFGHC